MDGGGASIWKSTTADGGGRGKRVRKVEEKPREREREAFNLILLYLLMRGHAAYLLPRTKQPTRLPAV